MSIIKRIVIIILNLAFFAIIPYYYLYRDKLVFEKETVYPNIGIQYLFLLFILSIYALIMGFICGRKDKIFYIPCAAIELIALFIISALFDSVNYNFALIVGAFSFVGFGIGCILDE